VLHCAFGAAVVMILLQRLRCVALHLLGCGGDGSVTKVAVLCTFGVAVVMILLQRLRCVALHLLGCGGDGSVTKIAVLCTLSCNTT